ncbi:MULTISPECIES: tRNA (adenosine(37)-N6)-dimethylallyltransferase MiaA [unclassified Diaminobutyricimonas]|uniref:tRNA (adenosine(37)-N6)-dimethylallyltransferase MiaA n=1 Tax=unclassified Diaminobutyricimonas TaxID=2643261 RepID=UPI0012F4D521|nr:MULTISPECIES: tRNA (adenosine(37)-N6)-dimethylallyltransferase MiaA [unclassified Diaminobutyricimonas]
MLIAVVGATGTGKSALALDLAEALAADGRPAEIVNADAMQLYRGMDIGTAKLPLAERRGIPHHLLDVLEVTDEATVARYQIEARAAVEEIQDRGVVPILVGGSGLYVSSVLFDFRFPGTDPVIRRRLETELEQSGPGELYRRLRDLDPISAASIGASNGRRIVRALEVIQLTGEPFSAGLPDEPHYWRPTTLLGLTAPRDELIARLDARVQQMWADGLVDEVERLLPLGIEQGVTASRAIGYAQAIGQLRGTLDEPGAIEQTASLTRRYARRQVSWFKRYAHTTWLDYDDSNRLERALTAVGRN